MHGGRQRTTDLFAGSGREWRIPVSDTQAYRQFGNAVVVPVVEAIAKYMEPSIMRMLEEGATSPQEQGYLEASD